MARRPPSPSAPSSRSPAVAIVGMACRFPGGAVDLQSFWALLVSGESAIREVPADRWSVERYYHPDPAVVGTMVTKWGGFVDDLAAFDARFWGISPREAMRMDPQQRWLLETAWEAIEDAGVPPARLRGQPIGVFVGIAGNDYGGLQLPNVDEVDAYTNSGATLSIASNRISYAFDFTGPSLSVDTACSSAAVAVWMACQSLASGTCQAALVGGVNALITPHATVGFSKAAMVSPSGRCFAFDARANGYVRGEGAGVVYLKPLAAALADGDRIYAVIRGSAVNQDGHTSSMTVPSVTGQAAMLREAYAQAGVAPASVAYVEAHGTGTPVGDPIEARALGGVLGRGRPASRPCLIGSVKTNIGHLEAGAGIAGLIKAALVLHRRTIPPSLNFESPNPDIPFGDLRLAVATRLQPLESPSGAPPVVGVNSFGFGGTNAHVVLQAAPATPAPEPVAAPTADRACLLPISARDDTALRGAVARYRDLLGDTAHPVRDVAAAAGTRRDHHAHRVVASGHSAQEVRTRLTSWLRHGQAPGVVSGPAGPATPLAFVFTGQGSQWAGMGRQLLAREPIFRRAVEDIDARFRPLAGWSVAEALGGPDADTAIDRTDVAQPAIFAVQVGLVALWQSWGVDPVAVVGHSVGEVAAAWAAGILSLDDAVTVIFHRSRLQHTTAGDGRMLAVGVPAARAEALIDGDDGVELAGINSPGLVTLAGDAPSLERVAARLEATGLFTRWLRIRYAFHSRHMDPIREELLRALADIQPRPPRIPFVSTVTDTTIGPPSLDAAYWWDNVRRPVLFEPAVAGLVRGGHDAFLEIGPHPALESALKDCLAAQGRAGAVFHSLRRDGDGSGELLATLAAVYLHGLAVDWRSVNQSRAPVVPLPRYPWTRESFWAEASESARARLAPPEHPFLAVRVSAALPTWQASLDVRRFPYLADHRVLDGLVFPAAGYGEIGLALARRLFPDTRHVVENLEISKALFLDERRPVTVQVVFDPDDRRFQLFSATGPSQAWELHAEGSLTRLPPAELPSVDLACLREPLAEHFDHARCCEEFAVRGYEFGEAFRQIRNLWRADREALAEIEAPPSVAQAASAYVFHPALQDACFQAVIGTRRIGTSTDALYLPRSVGRLAVHRDRLPTRLWAHVRVQDDDDASLTGDIAVYDDAGRRVADIHGFRLERVDHRPTSRPDDPACYRVEWEPHRLWGSGRRGPCAFVPAADIVAAARDAVPALAVRHGLDQYHRDYVPEARAVVAELIGQAFAELGWKPEPGDGVDIHRFTAELGIAEEHRRVTRALLEDLAKQGWLGPTAPGAWKVVRPPRPCNPSVRLRALAEKYPRFAAEVEVLERAGSGLPAVLRGELDPMTVLFGGGAQPLLERFYREACAYPAHLELLGVAVARAIERWPSRRSLRVLEVGGGTGALTDALLPVVPAHRTDYLFTDVGRAFLAAARTRLAEYPWIGYRTFDLEEDPGRQGIEVGTFDLVVAADVLHATADLGRTLSHLRACLADGGLLMFLEVVTRDHGRDNMVFGLLNGWWRFTDTAVRRDSALLERGQWESLLAEAGFHDVASFDCSPGGRDAEHATVLGFAGPRATTSGRPPEPAPPGHRYLLLADEQGVGEALAGHLRALGHRVVVVPRGPDVEPDLARAVLAGDLAGVVHCWSLDHPSASGLDVVSLDDALTTGVLSGFQLVRGLLDQPTPIWFVVRGVYATSDDDRVDGLSAAPLVGLARVANNEAHCRFSVVDVGPGSPEEAAEHVLAEMLSPSDGERETAYRDGRRLAPRLRRVGVDQLPPRRFDAIGAGGAVTPYRLEIDRPGVLTNLALHETGRAAPGPGEIEVRVQAGGLNFRDVMKALGTHPGRPPDLRWLGDDFAGVVERVGPDVEGLRPGDRVAGMAPYAFAAYAVTSARTALRVPAGMSFVEAATLPTAFLTAHYALQHLARLEPGERILIHAAAGGVGQAAVQVATRLGLEIFATAGTPEKRQRLRDMGVRHVMSSRTLEFADAVLDATGGRGVDAVLNSLAGEFIPKSLAVLAPFGRFLEIGKVDIYRNARLGLRGLRDNIGYFVVDLTQHAREKPALLARLFAELEERVSAGDYRPLPATAFPVTEAAEAFRFMAQARHVGKNVLRFDVAPIPIRFPSDPGSTFRPDATYLITGGAGGLGLEVAKWMARLGARHLVLVSRTGPRDAAARADIETLRAAGIDVLDTRADVTRTREVTRVLQEIGDGRPPLRGVFHAAMVLDDDSLAGLDEHRFRRVLEPKLAGAWNLHTATRHTPLEHFVCFSSFSAVVGGPRQSAYNAGNAFLQALAHHRRAAGLPALTVDWGAIAGAGFVERNRKAAVYLEKIGFKLMPVAEALDILGRLLRADTPQVAAARLSWGDLSRLSPLVAASPAYAAVARQARAAGTRGSMLDRLRGAGADERAHAVEELLVQQVAAVFGMAPDKIERGAPLTSLGLDSLMTVELVNRVERELDVRVPMSALLQGPSLRELGQALLKLLAPVLERQGAEADTTAAAPLAARATGDADLVVPLSAGDGPPVIAFHPVGGDLGVYAPLVKLLPADVPVHAVESRLMRGADREFESLDAMVAAYAAAVRATGAGHYRLFGFSLGGYLAARVAEALEREGETVALVGVVEWDARPRTRVEDQRDALLRLGVATYRFLAEDLGALRPLSEKQCRTELAPLVRAVVGVRRPNTEVFVDWAVERDLITREALRDWARRYLVGFGQHCALLAGAVPLPSFRAPLVVWRAAGGFGSPVASWHHAGAAEHVVAGDHFAFFRPPAVGTLATQLAALLRGTPTPGDDGIRGP